MILPLLQGIAAQLQDAPVLAILVLFGAGLATSLTPCIYPMIPITASVISGTSGTNRSRARVIGLTFAYVLGLALLYATMGLVAGLSGSLFGSVAANPYARLAMANLLLIFGLVMLDAIPIRVPTGVATWAANLGGGTYPAVFLLGATSGIVAAPCGAPAFAAVLTWVTTTQSAVLGFVYLFVFSLGMTAILVAVGISSGLASTLPKSGRWMTWVKKIGGVILIGMAEYYLVLTGFVW